MCFERVVLDFVIYGHNCVALRFSVVSTPSRVALIVEDEESIREVIADILRDHGFRVVMAANGREGLACLERVRPDVMVLDLLMPVMHGWDFMERYFEKTDGQLVPIVVVSVNPALPRSFNRLGVRSIVPKPFEVEALLQAVEDAAA
jgi:CheY-like chemotaxis protein